MPQKLVSLLFLVSFSVTTFAQTSNLPEGVTSQYYVASNGIRTHYLMMGQGVPVILLHGYYGNSQMNWFDNGVAQELAKTHQVIAIDSRGHGQSDKPLRRKHYG